MVGLGLFFVIYLGYGLSARRMLKVEFSHGLIFSFSIILSFYLIGALLNVLDFTIYTSFVIGGGLFCHTIYDFFKNNRIKDIGNLITWDIIIFIVAILAYYNKIVHIIVTYAFWDEYSLWAVLAKEFNHFHGLSYFSKEVLPNSKLLPVHVINYVQVPAIFQYSISKLIGYKAAHIVFANGLISIIFTSVMLVERKLFWSIILPLVAVFTSLCLNIVWLTSLYLDGTVGIVFGSTIAVYIQSKKYNNHLLTYVLIAPMLFILPNIKEVGYWFSFIIIILILVDTIQYKNYKYFKLFLTLPLLPILSKALWNWIYLDKTRLAFSSFTLLQPGAPFTQAPFVSIINLISKIKEGEFSTVKLIVCKFLPFFYSTPALTTYSVSIVTLVIIKSCRSELLKDFTRNSIVLSVGFVLYMLFRVDLYLTTFQRIEAINVASYERYFLSYVIVFNFCTLSYIKIILEGNWLKAKKLFYSFCIGLLASNASLKLIQFKLYDLDPYYFKDRQTIIKNLIENGLNENLDFGKHNLNMLDCFIYRYLEAPYIDMDKVSKCLEDIK